MVLEEDELVKICSQGTDNGSMRSGKMIGCIENPPMELRGSPSAIGTNIMLCRLCLLDSKRLATMMGMESHPSTLGFHSILSIHEIVDRLATLLLMSVEWSLRWTFRLRSNSR